MILVIFLKVIFSGKKKKKRFGKKIPSFLSGFGKFVYFTLSYKTYCLFTLSSLNSSTLNSLTVVPQSTPQLFVSWILIPLGTLFDLPIHIDLLIFLLKYNVSVESDSGPVLLTSLPLIWGMPLYSDCALFILVFQGLDLFNAHNRCPEYIYKLNKDAL